MQTISYEQKLRTLSEASVDHHFDAFLDVPWDDPAYAVEFWDTLVAEMSRGGRGVDFVNIDVASLQAITSGDGLDYARDTAASGVWNVPAMSR